MATERGMQMKADSNKRTWEEGEFPLACETCMGDNAYVSSTHFHKIVHLWWTMKHTACSHIQVRMMKEPHGKTCKICERPYCVFRWRPGSSARYKSTQVCQSCAKMKNVCQVCLLDLQYGLPVQVRDQILAKAKGGGESGNVPQSDISKQWQIALQERNMATGGSDGYVEQAANADLLRLARRQPHYRRNLPHKCSFYARGGCNRGDRCPFLHDLPTDKTDPLAKQNMVDRYYGNSDPVAEKMLGKNKKLPPPPPPADQLIKTVFVGGLVEAIGQTELREALEIFGTIVSVRPIPTKGFGFVEFAERAGAEAAIKSAHDSLIIQGVCLNLRWARTSGNDTVRSGTGNTTTQTKSYYMPPPPGFAPGQNVMPLPELQNYIPPPTQAVLAPGPVTLPASGPVMRLGSGRGRHMQQSPYPSMDPSRLGSAPTPK